MRLKLLKPIILAEMALKLFHEAVLHVLVQRVCFAEVLGKFSEVVSLGNTDAARSDINKQLSKE